MDLINTCLETTANYRTIAYYSHLIPVAIALFLGFFVLIKSKYSLLSKIFLFFTASFSLWLIGDVITWTSNNYNFIVAVWAPLDYINVVFFLLAAYFFIALVREKDIAWHAGITFYNQRSVGIEHEATSTNPSWYTTNMYEFMYNTAVGNVIIVLAGAVPGYWVTVATVDTIGRKTIQLGGFMILTVLFVIMGFAYHKIPPNGLLAIYVIAQFFFNFGKPTALSTHFSLLFRNVC